MCGIFGITGASDPFADVLAGLSTLEYRGYDSAGIAIADPDNEVIWRERAAEKALLKLADRGPVVTDVERAAIGHTRWATHGAPNEQNAHPHFDCGGRIAIVHNGIIENHRELTAKLVAAGHQFSSETDSEVIAHLLEDEHRDGVSLAEALRHTIGLLRGDFAIGAIASDEPDTIAAARRCAPLVVGTVGNVGLLASDVAALIATTRTVTPLQDDETVEIKPGQIRIVDAFGVEVERVPIEVSWDAEAAQKGGYPDFMSKEIREQPIAVHDTLLGRIDEDGVTEFEELSMSSADLQAVRRVSLIACGSSYHACLAARQMIESLAKVPCDVDIASEYRYHDPVVEPDTLVIGVSQSGETIDTSHTLGEARRRGAKVLVMTNVVDSLMTHEADGVLYTRAGPEIGVASTKCHVAQLSLLAVFALHLARAKSAVDAEICHGMAHALLSCEELIERAITHADEVGAMAERYATTNNFYFLGRRLGYPIALEGALKLKELAYVRAEAYAAGEMKHGPISLIEPGAVVLAVATRTPLWEKVLSNVAEMKARGATIVALCDEGDEETAKLADSVLWVPHVAELVSPIVDVVPLQLFAYEVARAKGNDVDRPRNLAKVVTVE